jgi:hypothetical protein
VALTTFHLIDMLLFVSVSTTQFVGSESKFPHILGRLVWLEHQRNYWKACVVGTPEELLEVNRDGLFC